jgi:hypothetical protein
VLLTPSSQVLAENDESFYFVPLLFYPEWATVNPLKMKGNMIRERTLDITSELAAKARDPKRWGADVCPEMPDEKLRHKEFMVFVCYVLAKGDVAGQPVLISFSGGEHQRGQNLASLIKGRGAPIYACLFEAKCPKDERRNANGQAWYGIDVFNPTSEGCPHPFVQSREDFEQFKKLHEEYAAAYVGGIEQADLGEEEVAEDVAGGKF